MTDTSREIIEQFIAQFESGEQGCHMDCDDAQEFTKHLRAMLDDWRARDEAKNAQIDALEPAPDIGALVEAAKLMVAGYEGDDDRTIAGYHALVAALAALNGGAA